MRSANSLALRVLFLLVLLLQACGGASREAPAAPARSNAHPSAERGPFLWQVERDGAVSHVFGTVHIGVDLRDLPAVVTQRLDESHTLITETSTEDALSPDLMARMMLPPDQSLRAMLGDEYWATLVQYLGNMYPAAVLDRLPPWIVQTALTLDPEISVPDKSLDDQLLARAKSQGKRLLYLETAEQQLDMLAQLIDLDDLRETLDDVPGARAEVRLLMRAYRSGNLAALAGLTLPPEELAKDPEEFEILLFRRNRAWMAMLERELSRGGVFVAVGAAHYVGENGLLKLLSAAGFKVTRLTQTTTPRATTPQATMPQATMPRATMPRATMPQATTP